MPDSPTDSYLQKIKRPEPKMWDYIIVDADPQDPESGSVREIPPECIKADRDCNRPTRLRKDCVSVPSRSRAVQIWGRQEDCFDQTNSLCWRRSWLSSGVH